MPVRRLVVRHCARKRGMALHHKLCHTLGVTFNLPHAETHTIVLPDAIAYNEDHAKAQTARISFALGVEGTVPGAALALYDLAVELGAPTALESLGVGEGDMQRAADIALQNPYWNPAPIEHDAILKLLSNALQGNRPA